MGAAHIFCMGGVLTQSCCPTMQPQPQSHLLFLVPQTSPLGVQKGGYGGNKRDDGVPEGNEVADKENKDIDKDKDKDKDEYDAYEPTDDSSWATMWDTCTQSVWEGTLPGPLSEAILPTPTYVSSSSSSSSLSRKHTPSFGRKSLPGRSPLFTIHNIPVTLPG